MTKRFTITVPDDLEVELDLYLRGQNPEPALTKIAESALRYFLSNQKWVERGLRPAAKPFHITSITPDDNESTISVNHDEYLAKQHGQ